MDIEKLAAIKDVELDFNGRKFKEDIRVIGFDYISGVLCIDAVIIRTNMKIACLINNKPEWFIFGGSQWEDFNPGEGNYEKAAWETDQETTDD